MTRISEMKLRFLRTALLLSFILCLAAGGANASVLNTFYFTAGDVEQAISHLTSGPIATACGANVTTCLIYSLTVTPQLPTYTVEGGWLDATGTPWNVTIPAGRLTATYEDAVGGQLTTITNGPTAGSMWGESLAPAMNDDTIFYLRLSTSSRLESINLSISPLYLTPLSGGRYKPEDPVSSFSLTAHATPEPAYAGILVAALAAGALFRRARRQRGVC